MGGICENLKLLITQLIHDLSFMNSEFCYSCRHVELAAAEANE